MLEVRLRVLKKLLSVVPLVKQLQMDQINSMAGEFKFEMFIDEPTAKAFFEDGTVPWNEPSGWKCQGVDPSIFPKGELPFKTWSEDHSIAAKFYALAHRKEGVEGAPLFLLEGSLPEDRLLPLFKNGSVRVYERTQTVAFTKLIYPDTFPGLRWH